MKTLCASVVIVTGLFIAFVPFAGSNQADDTTIRINGYTPGDTPFISKVSLTASDTTVLKSIQFAITPKSGSVTRPLSATYANYYLVDRGFENPQTGEILLPVYGLYAGYNNTVTLTYWFMDGSSRQVRTTITTDTFNDPCGYNHPTFLQRRTSNTDLSYDYILIKGWCGGFSPAVIDTDGALRWVSRTAPNGYTGFTATFFDNAIYFGWGPQLLRIDLDGTLTLLGDYGHLGISDFHHNIDRGKVGIILDADTAPSYQESVNIEVDASGRVLKIWNLANIISAAMRAGGDDPSQFVHPSPADWFHNNAVAYNRADDSVIISSRENFLICIDYETSAIKWILGDTSKKWYQFPSLRRYALTLAPGSLPPIGQHAVSITFDQNILVLDNGENSWLQQPPGVQRNYASPRKYQLNLNTRVATEVWNHEIGQAINSPICSSVYEDAPLNYLIDYSIVGGIGAQNQYAQLLGLSATGETIFYFQYPTDACNTAFNAIPVHLEDTKFPTVGPQPLNLSTRGTVSSGDSVLINGFIITGTQPKSVVVRALGPSLSAYGVSGFLTDPVLTVHNSSGTVIARNDNWQTDPGAALITANGLAPGNPSESATIQTLAPGAYTAVVTGQNSTQGVSLAEIYDVSPQSTSKLANVSGRGYVSTGGNVLISGFIIGDVASATVVVRALGPSLASYGVSNPLSDPVLEIYDSHGSLIASNDNWQDNNNAIDVQLNGLAPPNALESALVLHLPAGEYTAIVSGANGATGNALVEVYHLD
jgi:arylsulfate sulfotransferase